MANYTQSTFFAPKDALLPNDPLKLIKGSEIDPEFAALASAIGTKVDGAGDGLFLSGTALSLAPATLAFATPATGDSFVFGDADDSSTPKRATLDTIAATLAGTGLSSSGVALSVDINSQPNVGTIDAPNDLVLLYDASIPGLRSASVAQIVQAASGTVPTSRQIIGWHGAFRRRRPLGRQNAEPGLTRRLPPPLMARLRKCPS